MTYGSYQPGRHRLQPARLSGCLVYAASAFSTASHQPYFRSLQSRLAAILLWRPAAYKSHAVFAQIGICCVKLHQLLAAGWFEEQETICVKINILSRKANHLSQVCLVPWRLKSSTKISLALHQLLKHTLGKVRPIITRGSKAHSCPWI